jgi:hypothetical protein
MRGRKDKMTFSELIAKTCDADGTCKPVIAIWILASREYEIMDTAELLESIRISRN